VTTPIFFDLDGTLCVPRAVFRRVFHASCAPLFERYPMLEQAELLGAWSAALEEPGPSAVAGCLARAAGRCGVRPPEDLLARCAANLNARWAASQRLAPGVAEALATLGTRHPLGIITNGPSDAQRSVIAALEIGSLFRWIVVSGDDAVGVRKPDVGIFARALALAGCAPGKALYIGDSAVNDIGGAAGAGLRTCWVAAVGATLPPGMPEPDLRIQTLSELAAVLAR
jgi:putative hydrolase of the HAD superfamily